MFSVRIKIGTEWIDLTAQGKEKVQARTALLDFRLMNNNRQYLPDRFRFDIIEENSAIDVIQKIDEYDGVIDVAVYKDNSLYFYGFIDSEKNLEKFPEYQRFRLRANDYCQILDVSSRRTWRFVNETLENIAVNLCNHVGANSYFPVSMRNKRIPWFFATEVEDSILDILNNFLYEYGYVLTAKNINNTPVISAISYRDRESTNATEITANDFQGRVRRVFRDETDTKLYKANYRIIRKLNNVLLYADGLTGVIEIPAGGFHPENGDTNVQFQEYIIWHRDNFDKTPVNLNFNTKLDWGTITKDSEVIYAENQKLSWYHITGGRPFVFIEEHYPTHSRIVFGNKVLRTYLGDDYRVVGQRVVRRIPPGCTKGDPTGTWLQVHYHYTRDFYETKAKAVDASHVEGRRQNCTGDSVNFHEAIFETRKARKYGDLARINHITIYGDAFVSVGLGSAYAGVFNRTRNYTINNITVGDSTDALGVPIHVMNYQFVDTPTQTGVLNGWTMLTENGTIARISQYIGDTVVPLDRLGQPTGPPVPAGVAKFEYTENIFPTRWQDSPLGARPLPIYDKRGTKAVFIPPGEVITEEEEETSFLYTHEDASDFVQGILNDARAGNIDFTYEGYAIPILGSKVHPFVGEYVDLNAPEFQLNNERFIVLRYRIRLDTEAAPTVRIVLRRTQKWEPQKTYPDLRIFFPDRALNQWDPEPTVDRMFAYTQSGGLLPQQFPDPKRPYGQQGVRGNINWYNHRSEWHNQQNREVS